MKTTMIFNKAFLFIFILQNLSPVEYSSPGVICSFEKYTTGVDFESTQRKLHKLAVETPACKGEMCITLRVRAEVPSFELNLLYVTEITEFYRHLNLYYITKFTKHLRGEL
jgi:hypothetical protein